MLFRIIMVLQYLKMSLFMKRDVPGDDTAQSFSMNYHTLATNDDGERRAGDKHNCE